MCAHILLAITPEVTGHLLILILSRTLTACTTQLHMYIIIHGHPIDWIRAFSLYGTQYLNHLMDFHNQCTLSIILYLVANLNYTYALAY